MIATRMSRISVQNVCYIPFSLEIKKGILSFCVLFGFNGL
ncbi:hypothetical protein LEP1GSC170_4231 [Leptospira interrogans serovar Bataviae str. HAI135]|uniref:Uncharacterized protein n=1 Tax=Leptospira noguchii serovar Autumnalis str. ZUN142 TaxID=1085540 RepID=M6UD11_9LEPT|nr:hypothetical protein LEP1GSC170_4231 [Leptospira interrogans serovar Bataviae str. HAI135]EMO42947.1 hypothetical protein LEP1GSC186_4635 [Leptospira noguchii serovar Autumnalis str. ZUN142]